MKKEKQQLEIKNYPNFTEEKKLWRKGYKFVVGLDEAGRGSLAGPVVASAVVVTPSCVMARPSEARLKQSPSATAKISYGTGLLRHSPLHGLAPRHDALRDSKKLSPQQREYWYKILTKHPDIKWGIGIVSEKIIDKIDIFKATKLALKKSIANLEKRYCKFYDWKKRNTKRKHQVDFIILDGNSLISDLSVSQKAIVKADEKVFSCAAASIIAKVTRDRLMCHYAKKYPQYGFEKHKGYGTKIHRDILKKYGHCKIHRKSFKPVKGTCF